MSGSFYGGRKGTSFVIVKNYPDIKTMTQQFSQGNNFLEVKYDEYVLINTLNKNHPDNGKLFRRGYDYNSSRKISVYLAFDSESNEIINGTQAQYLEATYTLSDINAGGAVYIGTIVGPAGISPYMVMTSYEDAESKSAHDGYSIQQSSGVYGISGANPSLVPGKYYNQNQEQEFNDEIHWYCASLRTEFNDDGIVYIGFRIPYPVIDFISSSVSPYDENGDIKETISIDRIDDQTHPFYEKWQLSIPKGIKGDSPKTIYVSSFANNLLRNIYIDQDKYYKYDGLNFYDEEDVIIQEDLNNPILQITLDNQLYQIKPNTKILMYDLYNYDEKENPLKENAEDNVKTFFIGIFNQIIQQGFVINDNGDINIDFTDGSSVNKPGFLKRIDDITVTETQTIESGVTKYTTNMNILYNTYTESSQDSDSFNLKMIKDIQLEGSDLTIWYTDGQDPTIFRNTFVGIESVSTQNNQLIITLNNGQQLTYNMAWVSGIRVLTDQIIQQESLDENSGQLQVQYNGLSQWHNISTNLKWIDSMTFQQGVGGSNSVLITYNDGSTDTLANPLKSIQTIQVDDQTNQLKIIYNTIDATTGENEFNIINLQGALISGIEFDDETHSFVIHYTAGKADQTFTVDYPAEVVFQNSNPRTDDYKLKINTPDGQNMITTPTSPIDSIYDVQITPNHHLALMFGSSETREAIIDAGRNYPGTLQAKDGYSYTGWLDLGNIFVNSGILIGRNLELSDLSLSSGATVSDIVTALNTLYPNGLDDSQGGDSDYLEGRIVTVGASASAKQFYGFDYTYSSGDTYRGWYYLGSIDTSGYTLSCSMGTYADFIAGGSVSESIGDNGLYFIIED